MTGRILVVGAGFAGAVYARTLADAGYSVRVIDKRDHVAGNAYDFVDENGVRCHKYGPHLFHTSNARVFDWVRRFGDWVPYEHRVRARVGSDVFVPLPVNIETVNTVFQAGLRTEGDVEAFLRGLAKPIAEPANAAEFLYANIGLELTDLFFRPYTKKMWSMDLEDMSADVVKRIPLRFDLEDRYFPNEKYQILPANGYTDIFEKILAHEGINVDLGVEFDRGMERDYDHVFNSMPIDEYFDFQFGELPYRSIKFHHSSQMVRACQSWATTNYTDNGPLTRGTHWHLLPNHLVKDTGRYTYTEEEPCDYRDNFLERYYPVKTADGRFDAVYRQYRDLSGKNDHMTFIGRCGTYQYLDMHQVINQSLMGAEAWIAERSGVAV
jgi:UDP-galactopyranose mutase